MLAFDVGSGGVADSDLCGSISRLTDGLSVRIVVEGGLCEDGKVHVFDAESSDSSTVEKTTNMPNALNVSNASNTMPEEEALPLLPTKLPSTLNHPKKHPRMIKLRRNQSATFRSKPCRNWVLDGACRYLSRCKFCHNSA